MSNIIDVGINQGGIENPVPEAMATKPYRLLSCFMNKSQQEIMSKTYTRIDNKSIKNNLKSNPSEFYNFISSPESLNKKYPILKDEDIYILNDSISDADKQNLETCFSEAANCVIKYIIFSGYSENQTNQTNQTNNYSEINLESLYEKIDQLEKDGYGKNIENLQNINASINSTQAACSINKKIYADMNMDTFKIQKSYILKSGLIMLLITILSIIITVIQNYFSAKMSAAISMNLRSDVFQKVENFSIKEFDEISTASLITRTTNDVSQVKSFILMAMQCFVPPFMLIGGIIMALQKSVSMSWTIALGALVSAGIILIGLFIIFPKIELIQKLVDKFNLILKERISGAATIRIFGNDKLEEKRFTKANQELTSISSFVTKVSAFMSPILTVFVNLISLLIIWLSAYQIQESQMQVGDMMAFMQYAAMVIGAFLMIIMMIATLPQAMISINRIYEILGKEIYIKDPLSPLHFNEAFKGEIEFKNVSFRYDNAKKDVIQNINFTAKPGKTTAIIGSTGSGKSTLLKLILRLYDVTDGEILVDGLNIKDITQKELREKISYTPQSSMLFSGNIESNIKVSNPNISENSLEKYLDIARSLEFIKESKDGIHTKISQNGANLSGGQKQRLSIARSIAKESPIYIFDDIFSSLDFKTEKCLRESLFNHIKNSTAVIVSQRILAVMHSEKIIVLDEGKIAAEGKHDDLLKNCKIYREMFNLQTLKEEIVYE
jgi:ATP-binding cassette subfamily B protein